MATRESKQTNPEKLASNNAARQTEMRDASVAPPKGTNDIDEKVDDETSPAPAQEFDDQELDDEDEIDDEDELEDEDEDEDDEDDNEDEVRNVSS